MLFLTKTVKNSKYLIDNEIVLRIFHVNEYVYEVM